MTHFVLTGGHRLTGRCAVPGDKSISHRAVMFSALADGVSTVRNFLDGGDCRATIDVMRGLGVQVEERSATELVIHGRGLRGLQEPSDWLNCANSGTTIRLMTGLLAGQKFTSFLTGTPQIRRRPMARIVKPLRQMGAIILGRQDGNYAPLGISGGSGCTSSRYSQIAVLSAIVLPFIFSTGTLPAGLRRRKSGCGSQ